MSILITVLLLQLYLLFVQAILDYIKPVLDLAQYALRPPDEPFEDDDEEETESRPPPHLRRFLNPELLKREQVEPTVQYERCTSTGPENWIQEFELMNLPLFTVQYIQLVHVPLDVMHECLRLQLELKPPKQPSQHSVRQVGPFRNKVHIWKSPIQLV